MCILFVYSNFEVCYFFSAIINGGTVLRESGTAGRCITDVMLHSISYHQPQDIEPRRLYKDVKPLQTL